MDGSVEAFDYSQDWRQCSMGVDPSRTLYNNYIMYSIVIGGLRRPYRRCSALDTLKEVGVHPSRMYPHLFVLSLSIRASRTRERNHATRHKSEKLREPPTHAREKHFPTKGKYDLITYRRADDYSSAVARHDNSQLVLTLPQPCRL